MLTKIILTDYGAFGGRHEFDLTCTPERPLVLFGGKNGAGKTTIFESIMLCLYGTGSLEGRTTRKAYCSLLASRAHRDAPEANPSVEVRFLFSGDGQESEYRVVRSWLADGSGENLAVSARAPGGEFAPVGGGHQQEAVDGMVPPEVMRLFFIDGERIARMAADGAMDTVVAGAFGSLLGLDIVEQLQTDLRTALARAGKAGNDREEYGRLEAELAAAKNNRGRLLGELEDARTTLGAVQDEAAAVEATIARMGGTFAGRRDAAKAELAEAKAAHAAACGAIVDACSGVLPFLLVPGRMRRLRDAITEDENAQRVAAGRALLGAGLDGLAARLDREAFARAGLPGPDAAKAARLVEGEVAAARPAAPAAAPPLGLSRRQASGMMRVADEVAAGPPAALAGLAAEAVAREGRIAYLNGEIAAAPEDVDLGPLVGEAARLNAKAGAIQAGIDAKTAELANQGRKVARLESAANAALAKVYDAEAAERGADLTGKVQAALGEFGDKLKSEKARLLEDNATEAVGSLMHRELGGVRIDPEGFGAALLDADNNAIPKDTLSAGERQVLATALLWALARTSGRPLPFAVDTPLARLDGKHRDAVIASLPGASHQVLVFATDEEIGLEEYRKLEPCMACSYTLGHGTARPVGNGGGDAA